MDCLTQTLASGTSMKNVFTYGSLMYPEVFEPVALVSPSSQRARLDGWSRHAIRGRTYPAAVPATDSRIEGVVWMGLDGESLRRLDRFEGNEYQRETVTVALPGGARIAAEIYRWLDRDCILDQDWSQDEFERCHLPDFFRIHGA